MDNEEKNVDYDQFPGGNTKTEHGVRLVIPSPGWPCCPFSPALSSSGFHGNMLFLVFSSLSVSMWRTDLYSFVQPLVTASVSSLLTLASISYFTAASLLLLPKPVSQSGLLDPFVTIPLGRRQDARSHVFRVNFSVLQSCCSSAIHTTIHQTAQDRTFAVILSSPLLLPSQCQRHWGLSLLLCLGSPFSSLHSHCHHPRLGHYQLFPGLLH